MPRNRLPQRKSPRKPGYDYSRGGAYFVTICTHRRQCVFGSILDGQMHLLPLGQIAHNDLAQISTYYQHIDVPVYVVMPNHVHAIIIIEEAGDAPSLSVVVGVYKGGVTRKARRSLPNMSEPIWQTRYHDHIIRTPDRYWTIYRYIQMNPARWSDDTFFADQ